MRRVTDTEAITLLRDLVATPSVSGDEHHAVQQLAQRMAALGYRATIDEAGNAIGELGSTAPDAHEIMLLGHIDTVPGHIEIREADGQLWGRGSVDAKGPLCAFVCGAAMANIPEQTRITVIAAVGEETPTSPGASFVRDHRPQPSCVLIGEPSGWDRYTIGYKGRLLVEPTFTQPCGHSAGPHASIAEHALAWWNDINTWARKESADHTTAFEQIQTTIQSINTTTDGLHDSARILIGLRLPTWLTPDEAERAIRACTPQSTTTQTTNLTITAHTPAHRSSRSCDPARALAAAISDAGGTPKPVLKTGTSDMNTLATRWTCPIIAYGPGDSALDHTPNERINIDDYLRAIRIITDAVQSLAVWRSAPPLPPLTHA